MKLFGGDLAALECCEFLAYFDDGNHRAPVARHHGAVAVDALVRDLDALARDLVFDCGC